MRVLIANRGMSAIKFLVSMREEYEASEVVLVGVVTPEDLRSGYRYVDLVDETVEAPDGVYMDVDALLALATRHRIEAVFPGWGYLSERSDFAAALEGVGIRFLGPTSGTIDALGNKINSMVVAEREDVPIVRWSGATPLRDVPSTVAAAARVGLPCVLKDAEGGGGKGIRMVYEASEVPTAFRQIEAEMKRGPGQSCLFVMELMRDCRHIEIQVVGDGTRAMHLFGRDCTTQRRNQKLIEEGPIVVAPPEVVARAQEAAIRMAEAVRYRGLGTAEFLYTPHDQRLTFLEINPRLQVEHVVTELLTGVNLPVLLYRVAGEDRALRDCFDGVPNVRFDEDGRPRLPAPTQHVVAVRMNAESPEDNFRPSVGHVASIEIPNVPHSWSYVSIHNGGRILGSVDAQFGHLFTSGPTRDEACRRMTRLITHTMVTGEIDQGLRFAKNILSHPTFRRTDTHTTTWAQHDLFDAVAPGDDVHAFPWLVGALSQGMYRLRRAEADVARLRTCGHELPPPPGVPVNVALASTPTLPTTGRFAASPPTATGWRSATLVCGDVRVRVSVLSTDDALTVWRFGDAAHHLVCRVHMLSADNDATRFKIQVRHRSYAFEATKDPTRLEAPFAGIVKRVVVAEGPVRSGDCVVEMEALKMVIPVIMEVEGAVRVTAREGDTVVRGELLGTVEVRGEGRTTPRAEVEAAWAARWAAVPERVRSASDAPVAASSASTGRRARTSFALGEFLEALPWTTIERLDDVPWTLRRADLDASTVEEAAHDLARRGCGVVSLSMDDGAYVVVAHHPTHGHASFGLSEQRAFERGSAEARRRGCPRLYVCRTSGASLCDNLALAAALHPDDQGTLWIGEADAATYADELVLADEVRDGARRVVRVRNRGLECLDGCARIASETSLAYDTIPTLTYVVGWAVGIGAYLARLGHRVIQREDASLLLTGHRALNKLLGASLYASNAQLGGVDVMASNGIAQQTASTDAEAGALASEWLGLWAGRAAAGEVGWSVPPLPDLAAVLDGGRWFETMPRYGTSVFTARARIGGRSYAVVASNAASTTATVPVDPGDRASVARSRTRGGAVLYPESSYKFAQTLADADREGLPCLVWANWRGFSGGTSDMFDAVLKYGSMILDKLRVHRAPVWVYVGPGCQLRGGAMVVMAGSVSPRVRFWADPAARIGILEANAAYDVKFKKRLDPSLPMRRALDVVDAHHHPDGDAVVLCPLADLRRRLVDVGVRFK